VAASELDRVYVYAPDRLARKYAYQVMLLDEFQRAGVELVFLNRQMGQSPEDELLLQMQGMIAEYERAQILERSRRGKRHKAQQGSVNVLCGAPYGYRYITIADGGGQARYDINDEQAAVVRQIFDWVGRERLSISEVQRRLTEAQTLTPKGKTWWDRSTIWGILKNPAYKGQAAFGKTRAGELRPRLREQRGRSLQPRRARSTYDLPPEQWLSIAVPALVDEALFALVQAQLEDNRRRARSGQRGAKYLLQGLLVCRCCGYAYYGKPLSPSARKGHHREYAYYRCIGSDAYRFGGQRLCYNKQVRTDRLEQAVWHEVCQLLEDPQRLSDEYQRRLDAVQTAPEPTDAALVEKQIAKLRQGIARLIDGYAEGYLEKTEVEPRLRRFKERLQSLEEHAEQLCAQARQQTDLQLVIGRLEQFSAKVKDGLGQLDWHGCRALIRTLVKRVEIDQERINVVFRVEEGSFPGGNDTFMQHCRRGEHPTLWRPFTSGLLSAIRHLHGRCQPALDVQPDPCRVGMFLNRLHQQIMRYIVK
jgi:site-specific DNA recombinase